MIFLILLLLTGNAFADATIDTTYHYDSSNTPMGGQAWEDKPLTPVGSNYAARQDAPPPVDYTHTLISPAREHHTDIKPNKPAMTQDEMNRLNKEIRDLKQDVAILKEYDPKGVTVVASFER